MQTQANTPPPAEDEDRSDNYKPLTVTELDRLIRECCETEDWFEGQKMALRVFRAAPHPSNAEPARKAFKVLVNAMQGRDDQGNEVPGGISTAHATRLRNELLTLLGIMQSELFAHSGGDLFLKIDPARGIVPAPELEQSLAAQTEAKKLRDQATAKRKEADETVNEAVYADAPGSQAIASAEAGRLRREADELDRRAAELEGGAK